LGGQVGLELCGGADPVTAQDRPEESSHVCHDHPTVRAPGAGRLLVVRHVEPADLHQRFGADLGVFAVVDGVGALEPVGQLGDGGLGRHAGEELDVSGAVFGEPCDVVGGDFGREHVDLRPAEHPGLPCVEDLGPPAQLLDPGGDTTRLARRGCAAGS
jgi:hypothetical protein